MREIKFRAWDKKKQQWRDDGEFWYKHGNWRYFIHHYDTENEFLPVPERIEMLQFTGLHDWYVGDVIKKGEIIRAITVDYEHGFRFMLGKHQLCKQDALNGIKIGNIYENPEILHGIDPAHEEAKSAAESRVERAE